MELLNDTNTYTEVKGSWINTCHGSFYVSKVESAQEKVKIKLECYDIKYKLDIPFDPSLYSFPCTLMELRNKVFESSGVLYDNTPFPNSDMVLSEMPFFEEGISNRNVISIIAQAGGSFVDTDSSDKFYFKYFTDKVYPVNDYQELTTEKELTRPVNVIVLGRGDAEDNVYYPEDIKDKVPFRIDNNYILDSQDVNSEEDKRRTSIIPLYDRLKGTSYLEFSMKTSTMDNKLELNLGDKVRYKDIWGNIIEAPVMKKKLIYLGGNALDNKNYKLEISSEEIKEVSTDFNYASTIEDKIKRTEFKVDKQEGIIEALVKDTNDNFSKISQNSERIEAQVSSLETKVDKTVELLKTEFDKDNIIVQVVNGNYPVETKDYEIFYKVKYLGEDISLIPETESNCDGIEVQIFNDKLVFKVDKEISIPSLDNKYIFNFNYKEGDKTYTLTKTIVVSLLTNESTIFSDTEPDNTSVLWYDTSTNTLKRSDGEKWFVINDYKSDVIKINSNINDLDKSIQEKINKITESVTTLEEALKTIQTDKSFELLFNSLKENLEKENGKISSDINEIKKYIRFVDGTIILGEENNDNTLRIEKDRIVMYYGQKDISTWLKDAFDVERLKLGSFVFEKRTNGSLSFRKEGE